MKPLHTIVAVVILAPLCSAQSSIYLPDDETSATTEVRSMYPFWAPSAFESRYQVIVSRHRFDNYPVTITGLGFAAKTDFAVTNATIRIRFSYVQSTTLSTTFANNVGTAATTVLDAREHKVALRGAAWSRIGLQSSFYYIPARGDLAIDIITTGSSYDSPQHEILDARGTPMRCVQETYPISNPVSFGTERVAVRMQLTLDTAEALPLGAGCKGSNDLVPALGVAGRPALRRSVQVFLSNAPRRTVALLGFGIDTRAPFPVDLAAAGMPGCLQYFAPFLLLPVVSDARGTGQSPIPIPDDAELVGRTLVLQHYVLDPPATKAGFTTTNYGRLMIGY